MKDTPPDVNAMIFAGMMRKTAEERLLMGFDMMATAREMVWNGIGDQGTAEEKRSRFFRRYYGLECQRESAVRWLLPRLASCSRKMNRSGCLLSTTLIQARHNEP